MWQGPFFGALAGFCLAVVVVIIQWQQTATDIHKASQDNDMAGIAYVAILPLSAVLIVLATAAGAGVGGIVAAVGRRRAQVNGDAPGAEEGPNAAGGCLAVAGLYLAGMVLGTVAGGILGLVLASIPLMIGGSDSEGAGIGVGVCVVLGGFVGLVVGLAVASHKSKEL